MPALTRRTIIDCTCYLAEKKPLNKITIRDIVEECGITRNTFYYYFHDIFDVIDVMIAEKAEEILTRDNTNPEDGIFEFMEFCLKHRKLWRNMYDTVGYDETARYIKSKLGEFVERDIDVSFGAETFSAKDRRIIKGFYEEALFGVMLRLVRQKNPDYATDAAMNLYLDHIRMLFAGQLQLVCENSRKADIK